MKILNDNNILVWMPASGLVHTMTVTAANEHDITQTANLLRKDDEVAYGDSGYLGAEKRPEIAVYIKGEYSGRISGYTS